MDDTPANVGLPKMRVGFIGLGLMGKPMAGHIVKAGYSLTVHNRSRAAVDELAGEGGIAATSPADLAARAEIICLCVPDTPDVEAVLFGEKGVASAVKAGSVVIDFSTISAKATAGFAAADTGHDHIEYHQVDFSPPALQNADGLLTTLGGDDPVRAVRKFHHAE